MTTYKQPSTPAEIIADLIEKHFQPAPRYDHATKLAQAQIYMNYLYDRQGLSNDFKKAQNIYSKMLDRQLKRTK